MGLRWCRRARGTERSTGGQSEAALELRSDPTRGDKTGDVVADVDYGRHALLRDLVRVRREQDATYLYEGDERGGDRHVGGRRCPREAEDWCADPADPGHDVGEPHGPIFTLRTGVSPQVRDHAVRGNSHRDATADHGTHHLDEQVLPDLCDTGAEGSQPGCPRAPLWGAVDLSVQGREQPLDSRLCGRPLA